MSYVPSFEYDIFVSFTHADNGRLPGRESGWIDEFHYQLESSLAKRRGLEGLRIWRDRELHGNTDFDVAIEDKLDSTALFLVLHSRAYRKSDYCRKELDWFHDKYQDSLLVGENKRIFNILLNNYPPQEWHPALGNAIGFHMHDAEGDELGDFILPTDPRYAKRLRPIIDAAETVLEAMRAQQAAAAPASPIATPGDCAEDLPPRVFLAAVDDDQDDLRERLISELSDRAQVLEEFPPPREHEAHAEAVTATLGQANLSIHLLGVAPGRRVKDRRETSYLREQAELALSQPVPQILWLPEDLSPSDIQDQVHREWLEALESGQREKTGVELVRSDTPDLIALILGRIEALRKGAGAGEETSFLIDTHQKDDRHAFRLADLLSERGADVDLNKESRDPVRSLTQFEQAVRQVENLIILFGQVTDAWLKNRIQTAVKVIGEQLTAGEDQTLKRLWILLLPGSEGALPELKLPFIIADNVTPLDNSRSETIDPKAISELLALTGTENSG